MTLLLEGSSGPGAEAIGRWGLVSQDCMHHFLRHTVCFYNHICDASGCIVCFEALLLTALCLTTRLAAAVSLAL